MLQKKINFPTEHQTSLAYEIRRNVEDMMFLRMKTEKEKKLATHELFELKNSMTRRSEHF